MSKKRLAVVMTVVFALGLVVGGVVFAQGSGPGTEADPLVSKSYVDQYVGLEVVNMAPGQVIIGEAGTEIILRGGRGTAITSPAGGLADVTGGRDIGAGERIPANHLLIIPRDDGRGLRAVNDVILMVRGGYEVK